MSLVRSDLNQATPEKTTVVSAKVDKGKVASPLADLKNGKVVFKQKPISFENLSETMQEIVSFRDCIKDVDYPLSMISDHHLPLIAKLVHESDKSVTSLVKTLQSLLLPPTLESSSQGAEAEAPGLLKPAVVEHAIKTVAERINYGINADMDKPPAALCVWRWEVRNQDWLPKSMSDRVSQRLRERVAARTHLQSIFDALPEEERDAMLQSGKGKVSKGKDAAISTEDRDPRPSQETKTRESSEPAELDTKKAGRPKKPLDPETSAKEKERHEQKAIKAEKEKKIAEATKKSAAVFAKFFKPMTSKPSKPSNVDATSSACGSSTVAHVNEFQLTFKPFVVKKDAHLAPINYFITQKRHKEGLLSDTKGRHKNAQGVIELDDEGREVHIPRGQTTSELYNEDGASHLSTYEILRSFVESQSSSLLPVSRAALARRLSKREPKYCVRNIMHQLNDAEVQGDQRTTRKLTALLRNRQKLPAKVLVFHDNNRPGYMGTWTRSSPIIGPRTPFARDLHSFDYDHDSDAEWEEEDEGSVDDVESLDGSLEQDRSDTESDMGDWLVESDEIEVEPTNPQAPNELTAPPANSSVKRKTNETSDPPNKKRKIVPLIPFQKGPVWEKEIGSCDYEAFRPMRIQFFNDTPFPVDPFSFVSEPMITKKASNPAAMDSEGLFVMPTLPDRCQKLPAVASSTDDSVIKRKPINSAPPPKTSFPDAHIPLLLQKIGASNTNSFVVLLDTLFQELKSCGVKKNALEVKLREVAEKDKSKRAWVVKEQAWIRHGLTKPT